MATLLAQAGRIYVFISIHTTLAGGDIGIRIPPHSSYTFQSTPPSRVATETEHLQDTKQQVFQSTPPSRVATRPAGALLGSVSISIHTTLAGGDKDNICCFSCCYNFNPHHPRGWRPMLSQPMAGKTDISIHTTLAGGDFCAMCQLTRIIISIHTTLAGGDRFYYH